LFVLPIFLDGSEIYKKELSARTYNTCLICDAIEIDFVVVKLEAEQSSL
jgi:hypothetical protein